MNWERFVIPASGYEAVMLRSVNWNEDGSSESFESERFPIVAWVVELSGRASKVSCLYFVPHCAEVYGPEGPYDHGHYDDCIGYLKARARISEKLEKGFLEFINMEMVADPGSPGGYRWAEDDSE